MSDMFEKCFAAAYGEDGLAKVLEEARNGKINGVSISTVIVDEHIRKTFEEDAKNG